MRVILGVFAEVLGMEQLEILRDQLVAVYAPTRVSCPVDSTAVQAHDRVDALARLEVGIAPLLRDVVGCEDARADHQQQPIARRNRIANLLVKGELPRGHGDAVKPYVKTGAGQIGIEATDKCLIIIACVGEENGGH